MLDGKPLNIPNAPPIWGTLNRHLHQIGRCSRTPEFVLKPTDIASPDYFHKVVDCQWACPSHTPVPEHIRLIAHGRYSDAYMINWKSNVFPRILGRTCHRPCKPAAPPARVNETPLHTSQFNPSPPTS